MRNINLVLISLILIALTGCATTSGGMSSVGYDKYQDSYGEYKIVSKDKDLYLKKIYGREESRRLTNTPGIEECAASFIKNGNYIKYMELGTRDFWTGVPKILGRYIIPVDGDDGKREEISQREYILIR